MLDRLLTPNERMTDVFDRAATMNFTTVARVRGPLSSTALRLALRKLEQRHPLLRAGIERAGKRSRFIGGAAAEIPLSELDGPPDAWRALAERSLMHRSWVDAGPRAELTALRSGPEDTTLLLCLHHVVSDGSSGIYAMRDLIRFAADEACAVEVVASPGSTAFLPTGHAGLRGTLRALRMIASTVGSDPPKRLRARSDVHERKAALHRFKLDRESSRALAARARAEGTTVHGALVAALALALGEQLAVPTRQRVLHPVCLRRYLRDHPGARGSPGEAVGCYVSSVDSEHQVALDGDLGALAREVSSTIQHKKRAGVPLLTAPIAGPLLTDRYMQRDPAQFRALAEGKIMLNTFSLTNLGPLEGLGVPARLGELRIEDLFFVAAGSIASALGASASSFAGELSFQLRALDCALPSERASELSARTEALLRAYARA